MTYLTGEVTVIHDWTKIDFANYVYSRVMFSRTFGTVVINGTTITKIVGVTLDMVVDPTTTVIDDPFTLLLGNPKSVFPSTFSGMGGYRNEYSMLFERSLSQYMNVGDSSTSVGEGLNIVDELTVSAWLKPVGAVAVGQSQHPVDRAAGGSGVVSRGYAIVRDSDHAVDSWSFWLGLEDGGGASDPQYIVSPEAIETDRWVNVIGTWSTETGEGKLYVDGELKDEISLPGHTIRGTTAISTMVFAGRTPGPSDEFNGNINQVSVWNKAFDQEEVNSLIKDNKPGNLNQHPLKVNGVAWWPLGVNTTWDGGSPVGLWTAEDMWGGRDAVSGTDPAEDMTYSSRVYLDVP